jgi:radical SAM superfamily enzyme YgiQ (UPF0313 family)
MKITLIVTLSGDLVRSTEHIGIGYIASCLREHNHTVQVLEIKEQDIQKEEKYISTLADQEFVCITTTSVTMKCMNMNNIDRLAQIVKKHFPNMYIACDGYMATFRGKEILEKYPDIDFTVQGEGEITFCELIDSLENKKNLSNILGITYRNKNKIIKKKSRPLIEDLNMLPFPSRDQFEQHNGKFQYIRLQSSRGCLGNCGFCSSYANRHQEGPRWRGRSPKNIVDEIETIVKKYNFHTYDFLDWTFEDPGQKGKTRIKEIANDIINRNLNIYYNCCFRAENWSEEDSYLLQILVDSGLEKVNIGFESGNDRGLKILNKRATMEDNWRAIRLLRDFPQIYITFGFIMLHPYSTLQDVQDNAKFLYDTGIGQVIRHYFWMLEVYPDTLLEKQLERDNLLDKQYDINDGMYMYHFQNSEVYPFVPIFQEMLTLNSVWEFEIFDILVHTFITRLQRKYKDSQIINTINEFDDFVRAERKKIADFNYEFFMDITTNMELYDIELMKTKLNDFLLYEMNLIKSVQYKTGLNLHRQGYQMNIK